MLYVGPTAHPAVNSGWPIPKFDMVSFLNTCEGWNLYIQCKQDGDMRPYEEAKERYNAEHGLDSAQMRETALQLCQYLDTKRLQG